ncbi:hypothetical protein [Clostridium sp.]|uniref:hypothetical protein n=1 Tax=Clostridium sp. TaxID=1506 RepID=UPI003F3D50A2
MEMSKREKTLLGVLGVVLICVVYYQFIYTNQVKKVEKLTTERNEIEYNYNEVVKTINNIEKRKEEIKILNAKVLDKSNIFYPELIQEKIILELDSLLSGSLLKGSLNFSNISIQPIEILKSEQVIKGESSFKPLVDAYENNKTKNENINNSSTNAVDKSESDVDKDLIEATQETVQQLQVTLNFNGTYEALKTFIKRVERNGSKIVINNLTVGQNTLIDVSGSMVLEFYAVPKIVESYDDYLEWTLKNTYGKDTPFSTSPAKERTVSSQDNSSDFVMMVKSLSSDLPTITLGRKKDETRESYIYSDSSSVQDVEVLLTEKDGKYYCKYRVGNSKHPSEYTSLGEVFNPNSENILIEITSEARINDKDATGAKVKILNDTNKLVDVVIKSDDKDKPRVSIIAEGNPINVTNK